MHFRHQGFIQRGADISTLSYSYQHAICALRLLLAFVHVMEAWPHKASFLALNVEIAASMGEQKVSFEVDGLRLSGILHVPERMPAALVVGAHGLLADKDSPKQVALAKKLCAINMAYFRFDHRGCGESEGSFNEQTTLENRCSDLIAAMHAAQAHVTDKIPTGLFGSSLGGTICLTGAKYLRPFAIVTLAAPVQSRSIHLPADSPDSLKDDIVSSRLIFDIQSEIQNIQNILIIHGSADKTVPVENADKIYRLSNPPKKQLILENGDHRVTNPRHQMQFLESATNWYAECFRKQIQAS